LPLHLQGAGCGLAAGRAGPPRDFPG
jgi:hypothetical protein